MNRIGQTLLFEAAQHVSGQQAFEAGLGSFCGRCLLWVSTTVSCQITELLVRKHGVSATAMDNRQQNACFWAAKHGHSQLLLDSRFLVEIQSSRALGISWCWMLAGCRQNQCLLIETLLLNLIDCSSCSKSCPFPVGRICAEV